MWKSQRLTTLWASTACYRDSFTLLYFTLLYFTNYIWPKVEITKLLMEFDYDKMTDNKQVCVGGEGGYGPTLLLLHTQKDFERAL
jgi:hypothetical protein